MRQADFFAQPLDQSKVKTEIVHKYFLAWAAIMMPHAPEGKVAYIDLYAGPGTYADGTKSTPIRILESAIRDERLRKGLVTVFNDRDAGLCAQLRDNIACLPGSERLKYPPQIYAQEVDGGFEATFSQIRLIPTLLFLDPWGYKGVTVGLVGSVVKDWGCDCILFFNYNRINMGLSNEEVENHVDGFFGRQSADSLRLQIKGKSPYERERAVVRQLVAGLRQAHAKYVLAFRFRTDDDSRTSHYLIFASKHFRGYHVMKDIMARASTFDVQDVPSFEYNPARARQPALLDDSCPLDALEQRLPKDFAGRSLTMKEVYEEDSVEKPYLKRNYKAVLQKLESAGKIKAAKHRGGTFGDDVKATFPEHKA